MRNSAWVFHVCSYRCWWFASTSDFHYWMNHYQCWDYQLVETHLREVRSRLWICHYREAAIWESDNPGVIGRSRSPPPLPHDMHTIAAAAAVLDHNRFDNIVLSDQIKEIDISPTDGAVIWMLLSLRKKRKGKIEQGSPLLFSSELEMWVKFPPCIVKLRQSTNIEGSEAVGGKETGSGQVTASLSLVALWDTASR